MQKTAYEMRISDWSSDVCSSDLQSPRSLRLGLAEGRRWHVRQEQQDASSRDAVQCWPEADFLGGRRRGSGAFRIWHPAPLSVLSRGYQRDADRAILPRYGRHGDEDRKSVVSGKRVSVRVDLGGSRIIKKKK